MTGRFHWGMPGLDKPLFTALNAVHRLRNAGQMDHGPVNDVIHALEDKKTQFQGEDKYRHLKARFLDRLAEVLSWAKGVESVTCVAMEEYTDHVEVWITRNGYFRDEDRTFVKELQFITHQLAMRIDVVEMESNLWSLLVKFYAERLRHYVGMVQRYAPSCQYNGLGGREAQFLACLKNSPDLLDTSILSQLVEHAHSIRMDRLSVFHGKQDFWAQLGFLAKMKDAFIVLKDICRKSSRSSRLDCFAHINFNLIRADNASRQHVSTLPWSLEKATTTIPIRKGCLDSLSALRNVPPTCSSVEEAFKWLQGAPLHVHAEIQLVMYILSLRGTTRNLSCGYVGCSKLNCVLCRVFLASLGLTSKGCHYKIYHQWTIPETLGLPLLAADTIKVGILTLQEGLKRLLESKAPYSAFRVESEIGSSFSFVETESNPTSSGFIAPEDFPQDQGFSKDDEKDSDDSGTATPRLMSSRSLTPVPQNYRHPARASSGSSVSTTKILQHSDGPRLASSPSARIFKPSTPLGGYSMPIRIRTPSQAQWSSRSPSHISHDGMELIPSWVMGLQKETSTIVDMVDDLELKLNRLFVALQQHKPKRDV